MDDSIAHALSKAMLLGPPNLANAALAERYSIERHVTKSSFPPTFLFAPLDDAEVDPENTRRMDRALTAANVRVFVCGRASGFQ